MGSRFGLWGRFPMTMGGGKPRAQAIYEAMRDSRGEGRFSKDDNAAINVDLQASAHVLDCAAAAQERAITNGFPGTATDYLPDWEKALGRTPDANETGGDRRATLDGIQAGSGEPTDANILNALSKVLPGENVSIVHAIATTKANGGFTTALTPSLVESAGGNLPAGSYTVSFAFEVPGDPPTMVAWNTTASVSSVPENGKITVGPIALSTVTGAVRIHYYLSVAPNSTSLSFVGTGTGNAVIIATLPTIPVSIPQYHLGIVVSASTFADAVKRTKIDGILGPMLSGWTTYEVILGSPFIIGSSLLGEGGL